MVVRKREESPAMQAALERVKAKRKADAEEKARYDKSWNKKIIRFGWQILLIGLFTLWVNSNWGMTNTFITISTIAGILILIGSTFSIDEET